MGQEKISMENISKIRLKIGGQHLKMPLTKMKKIQRMKMKMTKKKMKKTKMKMKKNHTESDEIAYEELKPNYLS